jgi:hypothetical protein
MATQSIQISTIVRDPMVKRAFQRIERDSSAGLVEAASPKPVLKDGAAVRVPEFA